jgi:tRNA (Thr-GGU) A37 N-methylase
MTDSPVTVETIAHVVNGRPEPSDDYWGGIESVIRLRADLPVDTLRGLEAFSHIEVVWAFHRASRQDVHLGARSPRNDPQWEPSGTFVHRNHRRPSQIAVSHPRLLRVDGRDIHVLDLDAVDGTPVIDLAPWFQEFGPRGEVRQPAWPTEMLADYWTRAER